MAEWTRERVARLGFLVGQAHSAPRIAADPLIASTPTNVRRQAARFGLAFREAIGVAMRLPADVRTRYDMAAQRRGLTREAMIHLVLIAAGSDANLIENIVDDGA